MKRVVCLLCGMAAVLCGCMSTYDLGVTTAVKPRPGYGPQAPARPRPAPPQFNPPSRPNVSHTGHYGSGGSCTGYNCNSGNQNYNHNGNQNYNRPETCKGYNCNPQTHSGNVCRTSSDCRGGQRCVIQQGARSGYCR